MQSTKLATVARKLITGLALLLLGGQVVAQDAWLRGRALFTTDTAVKCIDCHTSSEKANSSVDEITTAIANQPCMNGTAAAGSCSVAARDLTGLLTTGIDDVVAYLSTPKHASLTPTNHSFADTAVDATANPTRTFTLTVDGDNTRPGSNLSISGTTTNTDSNFSIDATACVGTLAVGATPCNVVVAFNPTAVQASPFATVFSVGHDGFANASTATASGKGVKNVEINPAGLPPFSATTGTTSAAQGVSIANRLSADLKLCLLDLAPYPAPNDFNLVGRTYDAAPGRCVTLTAPGSVVSQNITFAPSADGPRFAQLSVQRLGAGGVAVGSAETIDLKGNDGPFATISGSGLTNGTLFSGVRQDVNAGAAMPSTVTVVNSGSATLRISSILIPLVAGAGSPEYTASGCEASTLLAPNASCDLSASFDPIDAGTRASQLQIAYSDAPNTPASRRTAVIDLQGQGTRGAGLVVRDAVSNELATGSAVAFGQQNIAVTYTRRMTLSNVGTDEALALSAPTLAPSGSGFEFSAPGGAGSCSPLGAGITLPAGSSCFVDLRFAPTAVGNYAATLALASRAAGASTALNNFVLNLSGDGVDGRPRLEWQTGAGSALSLLEVPGVTAVGSAAPPQVSLRLANIGPGAAALRVLNIIGSDASSFVIESAGAGRCDFDNAAPPLLEGATCEVIIAFRPQTAGAKTGLLQIVSTGTTPAPLEVRAQASGPAATIALSATPDAIDLDEVRIGAQSAPATVTLVNDGTVSALVTAIEASPGFAFERGSCAALPFSVQPRGSCTLTVHFAPGSTGAATGSLRVQVSGMAAPVEVALQGTGAEKADVTSGGCSMASGRPATDPTLWTLVLLAALALLARHRRRARRGNGAPR